MAQTYAQLQDQIAKLQAEAEGIRNAERAAVVAELRAEIAAHGITAQDLFGKSIGKGRVKAVRQAKYGDGKGNVWVGRGPRPQWLRDALAAGKRLEEFVFGGAKAESAAVVVKKAPRKKPAGGARARKSTAKK
jgi:DNA-binding protein H-NS